MAQTREEADTAFEELLDYLKRTRGFDFTGYKRPSLMRRVEKRMQDVGIADYADYQDYLEVHPGEFGELFNTILINVTSFFRDRPAWEYLQHDVLPKVLGDEPVRVWVAGCSSGEEAYTAAMVLCEVLGESDFQERVKIYATDADDDALNGARTGVFPLKAVEAVPPELRAKYFEESDSSATFRRDLRRAVIFGRNDLVQDAPISRVDLLICRNTLMYFNAELQGRILRNFNFALKPEGVLFLGKSEMLITQSAFFTPVSVRRRVFTKVQQAALRERLLDIAQLDDDAADGALLRDAAFDAAPVAQLVVDADGTLGAANELARTLLAVPASAIGRPFRELGVATAPVDLRDAVDDALTQRRAVDVRAVALGGDGDAVRRVDVQVKPMQRDGLPAGALVVFVDITRFASLQDDLERSRRELETAYEELQSTVEELETTNEELQSTNEELETTNEELQSTNEELETMNEELQSTNEELETMNDEFSQRTTDLDEVNSVLEAILTSLGVAVAVVGRDLTVHIWNAPAEDLWGVRREEAEGRNFLRLDIGLPLEELQAPLTRTLADLSHAELVVDATNRRGRAVRCRVKTMPLIVAGREIRGAIVLMDATTAAA